MGGQSGEFDDDFISLPPGQHADVDFLYGSEDAWNEDESDPYSDDESDDDREAVDTLVEKINHSFSSKITNSHNLGLLDCILSIEKCKQILDISNISSSSSTNTSSNNQALLANSGNNPQSNILNSLLSNDNCTNNVNSFFNYFGSSNAEHSLVDQFSEFRLEDIEAQFVNSSSSPSLPSNTSTSSNNYNNNNTNNSTIGTLHLQKINELTIIRNNMQKVLDSAIKKLSDEDLESDDPSLPIQGSNTTGNNTALSGPTFPESILKELRLGTNLAHYSTVLKSQILSFDKSIEIVNFIGGVIKMHSGVFPTRFLDNTKSLGTYLVGILHYYAQSISRTNFEVLIFESNKEEYELTRHNVSVFTKHLLKRNIFTASSFNSTVEQRDFFDWLCDTKNNVHSSVIMLDLTESNKKDSSTVLNNLVIDTDVVKNSANQMIEHMLYFGACCIVLKVPPNYTEKDLSTHNKLWRIYVKVFQDCKYMIVFNNKPMIMAHVASSGRRQR
ncbi:predicted protein [Naegleria gruberi]|uniref:Predicted protein n=1 Tax=Naegleria gruberi TaxID=5762 RepID=D2UZ04_NAEGR|nr:uncharacterized protein NAEGRDRAFT_45360 [Naegleria gruberi]EFC50065.1 predicted protein [Naegleria gruberi]|eukprot:XP_002682809.1 predicted protein [Naegleria gruberi strain NEG-M]